MDLSNSFLIISTNMVSFFASIFYFNNKINKLNNIINTHKIIDEVLHNKIINLERDIEKLENFKLRVLEKNILIKENRIWDSDSEEDEDD